MKCPQCGHWYDVYNMYCGPQDICPKCRAKRNRQKAEDRKPQGPIPWKPSR